MSHDLKSTGDGGAYFARFDRLGPPTGAWVVDRSRRTLINFPHDVNTAIPRQVGEYVYLFAMVPAICACKLLERTWPWLGG
jgi:hypothetical protein